MKTPRKHEEAGPQNLTDRFLEALAVPKERTKVHDAQVASLTLVCEPSGKKTFTWFRRVGGKRVYKVIGSWPTTSLASARATAQGFNADLERWRVDGQRPDENPFESNTPRGELTFAQLIEEYVNRQVKGSAHHPDEAERELRYRVDTHCADWKTRRLSEISEKNVIDLHSAIGRKHQAQANRVVEDVRSMFNLALRSKLWEGKNPCLGVTFYKRPRRKRYILPEEMHGFFQALATEPSADVRDFCLLALLGGVRKHDLLSLRWEHVELESNRLTVINPKNDESYDTPLVPQAVAVLQSRRGNGSPWVFPSTLTRSGHVENLRRAWRSLTKRAGLAGLNIHDIRRSVGSWLGRRGTSAPLISASLGHKDWRSALPYTVLDVDPVRESLVDATTAMLEASKVAPKALPSKPSDKIRRPVASGVASREIVKR
jgi:integrase